MYWLSYVLSCLVVCTAKKYNAFLASDSLIKQIPKILGPGLSKAGKFPSLLTHTENMVQKVDELKSTIRFQMKKVCVWIACVAILLHLYLGYMLHCGILYVGVARRHCTKDFFICRCYACQWPLVMLKCLKMTWCRTSTLELTSSCPCSRRTGRMWGHSI